MSKNIKNKSRKFQKQLSICNKFESGSVHSELEVPIASDVVYRHIWYLKKFHKILSKHESVDSPVLKCILNGTKTVWNISIRFWKSPNGKVVKNPLVICVNLLKCKTNKPGQAKVKYHFGIWDTEAKRFECCSNSTVALNLDTTYDLLSIGYINLNILKRHLISSNDIKIMLKLQIIQTENESHTFCDDMSKILSSKNPLIPFDTIVNYCGERNTLLKAHKLIICSRSAALASLIKENIDFKEDTFIKNSLDLTEITYELVHELIRYLYTDKISNLETNVSRLLPLSVQFNLKGLQDICERTLLDNLSPENIANILLLADECGCDTLKKVALQYCEDNLSLKKESSAMRKTLAWRVMELVNPELFVEACESICSSGSNIDSEGKN